MDINPEGATEEATVAHNMSTSLHNGNGGGESEWLSGSVLALVGKYDHHHLICICTVG